MGSHPRRRGSFTVSGGCKPSYSHARPKCLKSCSSERISNCIEIKPMRKLLGAVGIAVMSMMAQQPQGPPTLTNQRIGDLVSLGVSQQEILRLISTATRFNFDLRPGLTDALLAVGVSEETIKAMAAKQMSSPR